VKADYAAAQTHYQAGRWDDAITAYRRIVAAKPDEMRAWALMGLCATQAGDLILACEALERAATLEPTAANVHFRLGIVLYQRGLADKAEAAFRRTVALDPANIDARQNLAAALVDQGRHAEAKPLFEALLVAHPDFELAWAGLANVHRALGDQAALIEALERAVALNPTNAATTHLLTAARGETPAHPDWRYVEEFFDGYAARFETHLVSRLDYSAPETLAELIRSVAAQAVINRVLDLGCGTGLFGAAIRAVETNCELVGIDLSQRMVELTRARGIYAAVEKAEAEDYLKGSMRFDLVAATDVFIYVGDVAGIFSGAARCLPPGGLLAFTTEAADHHFVLETSGRYAHSSGYIRALAHENKFEVMAEHTAPLRRDGARFEDGVYWVLRKD
jgi:predicted TPR repeat methyltransferase